MLPQRAAALAARKTRPRALPLVGIGTAVAEAVCTAPDPPGTHLPAGKIAQAWVARQRTARSTVAHVRQFMHQRRHRRTCGRGADVSACAGGLHAPGIQQRMIEQDAIADRTTMHLRRQIAAPLQLNGCCIARYPARRQALSDLLQQRLAGRALGRGQLRCDNRHLQHGRTLRLGVRRRCDRCGQPQPCAPATTIHCARMD